MPNIALLQKHAERQIRRWGSSKKASIVRDGAVRATAYAARSEYKPTERALVLDDSERLFISAVGLTEIDFEKDSVQFNGSSYKINVPVVGPRPDGTIVFYDCNVLRIGSAA